MIDHLFFIVMSFLCAYVFLEGRLYHEEGEFSTILKIGMSVVLFFILSSFFSFPIWCILLLIYLFFFFCCNYRKEVDIMIHIAWFIGICIGSMGIHTLMFQTLLQAYQWEFTIQSLPSYILLFTLIILGISFVLKICNHRYILPQHTLYTFLFVLVIVLVYRCLFQSVPISFYQILALLLFLLFFLYRITLRLEMKQQRILNEKIVQLQSKENKERYEWLVKENEHMARTIHDMKKHLTILDTYMEEHPNDEMEAYREQVAKQTDEMLASICYGNPMINRILNTYTHKMKEENIVFNLEMDDMDLSFISPVDLSAVLSNMLDNAMESCQKMQEKFILLKIKKVEPHFIVIKMKNSCAYVKSKEGQIYTTKKDVLYHGFGLRNMEQIAHNYHGYLHTEFDDKHKIFMTSVSFQYDPLTTDV